MSDGIIQMVVQIKQHNPNRAGAVEPYLLSDCTIKAARHRRQVGEGQTPVAARIRRIGEQGLPVDGRGQVGGGLQDVGISRRAAELQGQLWAIDATGVAGGEPLRR